jgi:DNA-binding winged helix-turn-helix (wHTH) protein/tetratricopeptide (TPR) repeat protein
MTDARSPEVRLFGPFRFDVMEQRLFREGKEIKLRPKAFAILRHLTAHPQHLVTQEELIDAVWGKIAMSDSLLRTHVADVRRAIGVSAVETVVGRGYRFLSAVETEKPEPKPHAAQAAEHVDMRSAPPHLVGRHTEIGILRQTLEAALSRKRQMVFVTGDPGIGKTTLVDAFLAQVAAPKGALIASGICIEHLGAAEAYLPVLAALGALYRDEGDRHFVDLLARHAPTWLAQLPGLVADQELQALAVRTQGAGQPRMLRELAEVLDVIAAERPLVLVLEDVQWADASTTDLLAMLGARREPARILVVATCRPAEITRADGMARVIAELRAHKQATVLSLETWSKATMSDYLAQRFAAARFPEDLAPCIHRMTDGNPLFAVAIVDDLESRDMIRRSASGWELAARVADVANCSPETVRQLMDIQIDRLKSSEQRILEAASLVGVQFAVGAVAHALELTTDEIDAACEELAKQKRLLRFVTSESWPDGSIQPHYSFAHALYRDAALRRVATATKRVWHRRIAEGLEHAYGASAETIATEIAVHYDEAKIVAKAVQYYGLAGERAMRRFGRAEAQAHFARALTLVSQLPASNESDRAELVVLKHLGSVLIGLQAFDDPLLEQTFTRAAKLARGLGDDRGVLAAVLGLQRWYFLRGELAKVERHEGEVAEVLSRLADPVATAEATVVWAAARLHRGQLAAARGPLDEASRTLDAARSDPARAASVPVVGYAAGHLVVLSWLRGAPDEAVDRAGRMLALTESAGNPFHLSTALTITALAHSWRREPERALDLARRALLVTRDLGLLFWEARAMSIHHWAATVLEPGTAKVHSEELSSALPKLLEGAPHGRTAFTPWVVEVYVRAGYVERAMRELDEALAFAERTDERAWSSELHRLRGELLRDSDEAETERAIKRALEISRMQGAKSFELRAAMSLAKLYGGAKKSCAAREDIRRCLGSFTEGFGTGDLVEARALLDAGRRPPPRTPSMSA